MKLNILIMLMSLKTENFLIKHEANIKGKKIF